MRVLLVDDDSAHRIFASRTVRHALMDVELQECSSASDAFEVFSTKHENGQCFDLAIIDLKLDHESGLDVLSLIRKDYSLFKLPIIIISTSDLVAHIENAYLAGANCYIVKGSDPMTFCHNLECAIKFCLCL